jgi:CobQ-like glutamine amidotransferase family enzyme
MTEPLRLAYLYPSEMNIYGDRGNIITLQQRSKWRGIEVFVDEIHLGQKYDFSKADLIFGGGGQDKGQELVAADLVARGQQIRELAAAGLPMLLICGLYQLFGRRFVTHNGLELPGIGVFAAETLGSDRRMIGNVLIESSFGQLVGFENHSGLTYLDTGQEAFGHVINGFGNDGKSGFEGAISGRAIGTYLHGPVLPKNPRLADFLIQAALERKNHRPAELPVLDDSLEIEAADAASRLP